MNDTKKPDPAEAEADELDDGELDSVAGGYELKNVMVTSYQLNAAGSDGALPEVDDEVLVARKRPGRLK